MLNHFGITDEYKMVISTNSVTLHSVHLHGAEGHGTLLAAVTLRFGVDLTLEIHF